MHWLVVFLGLFLLFALLRIPVAVSMSIATLITMLGAGVNFGVTGLAVFNGLNSFTFLAIPAFIIAGDIMGVIWHFESSAQLGGCICRSSARLDRCDCDRLLAAVWYADWFFSGNLYRYWYYDDP